MQFVAPEKQPMSVEIYRCRKCGKMLAKGEVIDRDGAHFCAECDWKRKR